MKKSGPDKTELDYKVFDALVQFKVSNRFCADYMGLSPKTIERRLREDHDMTFSEYQKLKSENVSLRLQQKAISIAMNGNVTMMIFCLKNMAGWSDNLKSEINDISDTPTFKLVKEREDRKDD